MKIGVIVFPGSNCDRDAVTTASDLFSGKWGNAKEGSVTKIWHKETALPKLDLVILPGGFSYGDYLRSGAMAAHSPVMQAVKKHADAGGKVIGICNGFQILTESGLLPGTLMRNQKLRFLCKTVTLRVENNKTAFTSAYGEKQIIRIPIAHHDGCYFAAADELKKIEDNGQVLFRYCTEDGTISQDANINGSLNNIAGIMNASGNVAGMMPHPERVCDEMTGGIDGRKLFTSLAA